MQDHEAVLQNVKEIFEQLVADYLKDNPLFSQNSVSVYYYDSYSFQTNVSQPSILQLYVEFNEPKNVKSTTIETGKTESTDVVEELHLSLAQIKEDFYNIALTVFNEQIYVGKTRHGVLLQQTDAQGNTQFFVNVIPCLTYKNQNEKKGVLYYSDYGKQVVIDYPTLTLHNWNVKNKQTNGSLTQYAVLFKNLYMKQKKVEQLPTEMFETIVYNVPNNLLKEVTFANAKQIISYLKSVKIREMISIDEQDKVFTTRYRAFSWLYAKYAIKNIAKQLNKLS